MYDLISTAKEMLGLIEAMQEHARSHITVPCAGELLVSYAGDEPEYTRRIDTGDGRVREKLGKERDPKVVRYKESAFFSKQLRALEQSRKALEQLIRHYREFDPETIRNALPPNYRVLPPACYETPKWKALVEWANGEYPANGFEFPKRALVTPDGQQVRSMAEYMIYLALQAAGIPFRYEARMELRTPDGLSVRRYPDFTFLSLTGHPLYWEHLGLLDDPKYAASAAEKLQLFFYNGILPGRDLILTSESADRRLTAFEIETVIRARLMPLMAA